MGIFGTRACEKGSKAGVFREVRAGLYFIHKTKDLLIGIFSTDLGKRRIVISFKKGGSSSREC